jgi:hypothetical protein
MEELEWFNDEGNQGNKRMKNNKAPSVNRIAAEM